MLKRLFLSLADVDWCRTKAFSVGNFGQVYLNTSAQRQCGIVTDDEYEALRDRIAADALALRDPVDGHQIVKRVYKREELFHGPSVERLPDLVLYTDRARYVSFGHADFGSNKIVEPITGLSGHHRPEGLVILSGPGVTPGTHLEKANIMDLAPTILHTLGLDVPSDLDGRVLPEIVLKRRRKDIGITKETVSAAGTITKPRAGREIESVEDVELQQQMNRYFAVAAANAAKCSVKIVNLRYPETTPLLHAEDGAEEILRIVKGKE